MKSFICLVTILGSLSIFAKDVDPSKPCSHCTKPEARGLPNTPDIAHKMIENVINNDKKLKDLGNRICDNLTHSKTVDNLSAPMAFKSPIAEYLKIDVNAKDTRKKIIEFWNTNKDKLICTLESNKYITPQPVMRRVIDMNIQEDVFFNFLLEDENDEYGGSVDINIVHVNLKGESETVLDYIQSIRDDKSKAGYYDFDELRDLQESLQNEYGGKYLKYANKYPGYALDA